MFDDQPVIVRVEVKRKLLSEINMKKFGIIIFGSILFLLVCYGVGRLLHKSIPQPDEYNYWEECRLVFDHSSGTSDNPWGITAGFIETENDGNCLLLTPGTSVSVSSIHEESTMASFSFESTIHPWVAKDSDGATVTIRIISEEGEYQEEFAIDSNETWKQFDVDLSSYHNVSSIELLCDCGPKDDESCDWVLIKKVLFN